MMILPEIFFCYIIPILNKIVLWYILNYVLNSLQFIHRIYILCYNMTRKQYFLLLNTLNKFNFGIGLLEVDLA